MKLPTQKTLRYALILSIVATLMTTTTVLALNGYMTTIVDDTSADVGRYTSLALNSSGFPVISYYDSANGDLKVAVCGDEPCTTSILSVVDSVNDVGQYTSLVLNSSGFPVISFYDVTNGDLRLAVCGNADCSSGNVLTTVDSAGTVGEWTSLVLNSSGFPVISYYDRTNGDLMLVVCLNTSCTTSTQTPVDTAGDVGRSTSLALNGSGFPVISYFDVTNGDMKVVVCGNVTCSSGNTFATVDSAGNTGWDTSLELNSSGFPVISYYDASDGDLEIAICGNATCTSGNTLTTIDSAGSVGWDTSLELNGSGFPVISYYDITNGDLKVAICGDATCTTSNLTIVDSAGNVGTFTSQKLSSAGYPIISYFDGFPSRHLKVAAFDPTAPTITATNLIPSYTTGPVSFTFTFSEDVSDAGGGAGTDDVTNPDNYLLLEENGDDFQTTDCLAYFSAGTPPNDTHFTVDSVNYDDALYSATINFNGGSALPDGTYRLFVCGTTSIIDLVDNPLNGGADTTYDFSVGAGAPTTPALPETGFAPGRKINLPSQSTGKSYVSTLLTLEIPALNITMPIVGVPIVDGEWDVTWLGRNAGYLSGSAFPTWSGNTVLTGHVWDSFNQPGPFAQLKTLKYDDPIYIHAWGLTYTYEVRESNLYWSSTAASKVLRHEEFDWITLLTCETYNPFNNEYFFRRAVRAVLISVK